MCPATSATPNTAVRHTSQIRRGIHIALTHLWAIGRVSKSRCATNAGYGRIIQDEFGMLLTGDGEKIVGEIKAQIKFTLAGCAYPSIVPSGISMGIVFAQ